MTIGVNDSWKKHKSPIYATADEFAIKRDYPSAGAYIYYFTRPGPEKPRLERITLPDRPKVRFSGSFAYWIATLLRPTRIRLLGFDMETDVGHFHENKSTRVAERIIRSRYRRPNYYGVLRRQLLEFHRDRPVETFIWCRGEWQELEPCLKKMEPSLTVRSVG